MRQAWIVSLVAALGASALSAQDLGEIKKRGVLRAVCNADEDPEMFAQAPAASPGFEREILEGFARLHALKLDVVAVKHSDERIPALNKGDGDVIIGIIETEARRKLVDFSVEVIPARHLVVNRKPAKPLATLEEFRAARVGVLRGTTWAEAAVEAGIPAAKLQEHGTRDELFEALRAGKISATVMSVSDFTLLAKRNPDLQGGAFVGAAAHAGWAVRKDARELKQALDEYIGNFRKSSWSRLVVKYFGEESLAVLGRSK